MSQTKRDVILKAEVILLCPCVLASEGGGDHCNITGKHRRRLWWSVLRYFQTICHYEL